MGGLKLGLGGVAAGIGATTAEGCGRPTVRINYGADVPLPGGSIEAALLLLR